MSTDALVRGLGDLMLVRSNMDHIAMGEEPTTPHDEQAWQEYAAMFLRDHGSALVESLRDAGRYKAFVNAGWPVCFLGVEYRSKAELDEAIDQARAGK